MGVQLEATAGEEGLEKEGLNDGSADGKAAPVDDSKPEQGGESDSQRGEAVGEAGKDGEAAEGEVVEEEGAEPELTEAERAQALKADILRELKGAPEDEAPEDVLSKLSLPEMNEKNLPVLAQKFGISEDMLPGFQAQMPAVTALINHAIGNVVKHFQGQFAGLNYEKAIESLAKDKQFADAPALRAGIDEFMKDFSPVHRSNVNLIKKGVIYARGLSAKAQVRAAADGAERKTKIIGKSKPSSGGGGSTGGKPVALSAAQESASALYPGGRAAYIKHLQSRGRSLEPAAR